MAILDPIPREQAEDILARVREVPGVADMHGGAYGEASLLYPGARVRGLRIDTDDDGNERLEAHIVADLDATGSLGDLASRVRDAAAARAGDRPVDVIIADAVAGGSR